jgi:excisionase family DNA binding protein
MTDEILNPQEVARFLELGESTVYRALEDGRIPGSKVCGRWRTLRSQLLELVHDDRIPAKRERRPDPMPRPARSAGRFGARVVDLGSRRSG